MYGNLRKDENSSNPPSTVACRPNPSPTSGDDCTKGDNTLSGHDGGTDTNTNRYARKKCGLKPIRPANIMTPLNPMTPGKLPHTPARLNFKENEQTRYGMHDFSTTPKYRLGRSESTPELHRVRKFDCSRQPLDQPQDKTQSNILQEINPSNLMSQTSDSLPDIFRKPLSTQQQDGAFNVLPKTTVAEDRVSKWGYGPHCNTPSISGNAKIQYADTQKETVSNKPYLGEHHVLKPVFEESPVVLSKFVRSIAKPPPTLIFPENPLLSSNRTTEPTKTTLLPEKEIAPIKQLENQSVPYPKLVSSQPVVNESIVNKSHDKSGLNSTSDSASATGQSSQPTVKHQPLTTMGTSYHHTPVAKTLSWNNPSTMVTTKMNNAPQYPASSSLKTVLPTADTNHISSAPIKVHPPVVVPQEQPNKVSPPSNNNEPNKMLPPSNTHVLHPTPKPSSKNKQISVNGKLYTVMKQLGRGGSSVVYQVFNQEMTDVFALKVVRLDSVDEVTAEGYINEVRLLIQLQDLPRVVRLLDYEIKEDEKLLLVMEKGDTDLASVIRNRTNLNTINPILIRFYWQEMLEAVGEIHRKNVIHTDLKPANFLVVNGGLKLIDFGIATSIQADMTSIMKDSQCGTYNYMAPEAIKSASPVGTNQEYKISRKTDVWSLGCMLYSLIYKNPPFQKFRDTIEKINAIVDERYVIDYPITADPMAIAVLKGCLDRNPRNRPSIEELLSHPYLTCMNQISNPPAKSLPIQIRSHLEPFIQNGRLSEEAKEVIRQWM